MELIVESLSVIFVQDVRCNVGCMVRMNHCGERRRSLLKMINKEKTIKVKMIRARSVLASRNPPVRVPRLSLTATMTSTYSKMRITITIANKKMAVEKVYETRLFGGFYTNDEPLPEHPIISRWSPSSLPTPLIPFPSSIFWYLFCASFSLISSDKCHPLLGNLLSTNHLTSLECALNRMLRFTPGDTYDGTPPETAGTTRDQGQYHRLN